MVTLNRPSIFYLFNVKFNTPPTITIKPINFHIV